MLNDILSLNNQNSLVRLNAKRGGLVSLKEFNEIPTYRIPEEYKVKKINFSSENYAEEIRKAVSSITRIAEKKGCNSNLFTALYEATLNAHQHGNNLDPTKTVTLAYEIKPKKAKVAVIDQGGIFKHSFIPFILSIREQGHYKELYHNYYQFSGEKKPKTNNGTGTSFMHTYVDDVAYLKSEEGGLVVHLIKTF